MRKTTVKEIDFSSVEPNKRRQHPDIDNKSLFIALINGLYWIGPIVGNSLADGWGAFGHQFDPPGTNGCHWQKVWKVIDAAGLHDAEAILLCAGIDPVQLAIDDEMRFATECRQWAIDHRCTSNGHTITEESPIEAWFYKPMVQKMDNREDEDDDY